MSKYTCKNGGCSLNGKVVYQSKTTYKFSNGELIKTPYYCKNCKKQLIEIEEEVVPLSEKNILVGKFSSYSKEEKKAVLKKRAHEHYNKEIKERKRDLLGKAFNS